MKKTALMVAAVAAIAATSVTAPARAYEFTVTGDAYSDARRAADLAADAYYSGERCSYGCTVTVYHGGYPYRHRYYIRRHYKY
jgi:phospholipase/lecithinase/hemolysin